MWFQQGHEQASGKFLCQPSSCLICSRRLEDQTDPIKTSISLENGSWGELWLGQASVGLGSNRLTHPLPSSASQPADSEQLGE